jgi:hypothetical protein
MSGPVSHAEGHYKLNESPPHKFERLARLGARIRKKVGKKEREGAYSGGISA